MLITSCVEGACPLRHCVVKITCQLVTHNERYGGKSWISSWFSCQHENYSESGYACCVPDCYSNSKKEKKLSYHKFPKDGIKERLRTKWTPKSVFFCILKMRRRLKAQMLMWYFLCYSSPFFRKPPKERSAPPTAAKIQTLELVVDTAVAQKFKY